MKLAMASMVAGVERERAVRYGSIMTSAVPATGTVSTAADDENS